MLDSAFEFSFPAVDDGNTLLSGCLDWLPAFLAGMVREIREEKPVLPAGWVWRLRANLPRDQGLGQVELRVVRQGPYGGESCEAMACLFFGEDGLFSQPATGGSPFYLEIMTASQILITKIDEQLARANKNTPDPPDVDAWRIFHEMAGGDESPGHEGE